MSKRTTIYINPPIAAALRAGTESVSSRLGAVCGRYGEIVRRARIAARFTEPELDALRDCCNGTLFDPAQLIDGAILANFEDSLVDGLAEKWDIDPEALAAKLRGLPYSDQVALVEDIEAFRQGVADAGQGGEKN